MNKRSKRERKRVKGGINMKRTRPPGRLASLGLALLLALQALDPDVAHREVGDARGGLRERERTVRRQCHPCEQHRNPREAPRDASASETRGCAPLHILTTVYLSTSA